jgi:glycine/D-amino acid oxidase-like deaminating enzyme
MSTCDWIVVGGGLTGAALSYELARQNLSVLLIEQHAQLSGATRFSYGGIAYWSGTTSLTCQLYTESKQRYLQLTEELDADIQFRELDLLLTIPPDRDPQAIAATYTQFSTPPQLISVAEACQLEPLLNPQAIAGALTVRHGHVHPIALTQAYLQAFSRFGGQQQIDQVVGWVKQGDRITGVITPTQTFTANNIVVCAGGWSRALLQQQGISLPLYFTHAEAIEVSAPDLRLQTMVMSAVNQRLELEDQASAATIEPQWKQPNTEVMPTVLDAGAVQFLDGRLCIGQISRALSSPISCVDASASDRQIRDQVGQILPAVANLPGSWHHCLIAFSRDRLPFVGAIPNVIGLHIFSGLSSPFALVPSLAKRFAQSVVGKPDPTLANLSPARFSNSNTIFSVY